MRPVRWLLLCCALLTIVAVPGWLIVTHRDTDPAGADPAALTTVPNPSVSYGAFSIAAADQATRSMTAIHQWNEAVYWNGVTTWVNAVEANQREAARAAQAAQAAAQAAQAARMTAAARMAPRPVSRPTAASQPRQTASTGTGRCGGNLPPCSVMMCESGGSLTAMNSSGAAGKWQIVPGTWAGYGGYSSAASAPEAVQDARAAQIYAGGAGAGNWVCK